MWCVADLNEEYITRMEDVLALYEKPLSEAQPVVCVDEKPVVLHAESRPARPMRPGQIPRRDSEYKRCGTANVFCGVQPKAGRHFTKVTPTRCSPEFADYLLEIAASYPEADTIHLVMDNLEFASPQGVGGPVRREDWRLAMEAVYGALHAQTRKLARPGGDRDQPIQPPVPWPPQNPFSSRSTKGSQGLEP
jgi:hypothetical protein